MLKRPGDTPGPRRATVWDVARAAGVSAKTVSRVLNDEPGVAAGTAGRVRAAMAELGFRRNEAARRLRTGGPSGTVGMVVDDLHGTHVGAVVKAVEIGVRAQGYLLVVGGSGGDPQTERNLVGWLLDHDVAGLLLLTSGDDHAYLRSEVDRGLPVVFIDRPPQGIDADSVVPDNVDGARRATHHLLRHWHRRIGFIGGPPAGSAASERLDGYRQALTAGGIWVDPELIRMGADDADEARQAAQQLLALSDAPTGIVVAGTRLATGAMRGVAGSATALVALEDLDRGDPLSTPLTAVSGDPAAMGARAAELLADRLAGKAGAPQTVVLGVELVARGSGEVRPGVGGRQPAARRWYRR